MADFNSNLVSIVLSSSMFSFFLFLPQSILTLFFGFLLFTAFILSFKFVLFVLQF